MKKISFSSVFRGSIEVLKNYFIKMRFFFLIFAILGVFFILFPQFDEYVSSLFYEPENGFYLSNKPLILAIYHGVNYATVALITAFVLLLGASFIKKTDVILGIRRKSVIFLLAGLILASGVVVNLILKEGVGRPRPQDVTLFGGDKLFQPPFVLSDECADNCSFVSGHASLGFYLMGFGLVAIGIRRKYMLAAGFACGWIIGIVRIIQGRHFFTDVLFSFFFVYAALVLIYEFAYYGNYTEKSV